MKNYPLPNTINKIVGLYFFYQPPQPLCPTGAPFRLLCLLLASSHYAQRLVLSGLEYKATISNRMFMYTHTSELAPCSSSTAALQNSNL